MYHFHSKAEIYPAIQFCLLMCVLRLSSTIQAVALIVLILFNQALSLQNCRKEGMFGFHTVTYI
jgi:hypothetical protein